MNKEFHGIIPALVTPFTPRDEVDTAGLRWIVGNCIKNGVHSIIVNGSLGEFTNLSTSERQTIIKTTIEEVNGKIPVIVGVGSPGTKNAVELAKEAAEMGADALLVLPPFYFQIGEDAVFAHFKTIAESVDTPMMVYNFPGTTKITMSPPLVARLAQIDGIIGIKNSYDSVTHLRELVRLTKDIKTFSVIAGLEDLLLPGLLLGARGSVSGLSNFVPQVLVEVYNKYTSGNISGAAELFNRVVVPLKVLAPPPEPISSLKIGVKLVSGKTSTMVRYPLLDAAQGTEEKMGAFLREQALIPQSQSAK
jgi:4-hydroxy-tetrahydrodipicolinate synthase